ncbi:MAG: tetratricopeptide repeat protein [Pseudomonadota bacterium]
MSAVEDSAAGKQIMAGEYEAAADDIRNDGRQRYDAFAKATNLCVSLTLSDELDAAEAHCESAVQQSRNLKHLYKLGVDGRASPKLSYAIALSNLGVLRVMTGDLDTAESHFEKAASIATRLDSPDHNLSRLQKVRSRIAKR